MQCLAVKRFPFVHIPLSAKIFTGTAGFMICMCKRCPVEAALPQAPYIPVAVLSGQHWPATGCRQAAAAVIAVGEPL